MNIEAKIQSLTKLGDFLQNIDTSEIKDVINLSYVKNKWFTPEYIKYSLDYWAKNLNEQNLISWTKAYNLQNQSIKSVGLVLAGNIPLVGFHDIICVYLSGHKSQIKASSKDDVLIPFIINKLIEFDEDNKAFFEIAENLKNFDAVIATGSNNTARYFENYFKHVPNIIRKNRTSIAILDGNESKDQIFQLGYDLFRYYGQGCRNVSKIYIPESFELEHFFESIEDHGDIMHHNKYKNNLDYNLSILLLDKVQHLTNNFVILQENDGIHSPTSIVYYERYKSQDELITKIESEKDEIQCICSDNVKIENAVKLGESQSPKLNSYADNIDTLDFLGKL